MTTEKVIEFSNELADYIYEKQKLDLNIGIAGKSDDMHEAYIQAHRRGMQQQLNMKRLSVMRI